MVLRTTFFFILMEVKEYIIPDSSPLYRPRVIGFG
jgi:hypothetical protein